MLDIKRQAVLGKVVYHLQGRIDGQSSEPLYQQIIKAEAVAPKSLTLSLGGVDFVSSAGIRTVIKLTRWCKERGASFAIASMQTGVAKIFEIAAALPSASVFASEAEADAYFEAMARKANRGDDEDD
ncbi:hypothetical protein LBMAG49_02500 [Planctomycetota bacterium]|nr:hypothetical protein LBMAG49_02500 [Planctomycetota bacterium]